MSIGEFGLNPLKSGLIGNKWNLLILRPTQCLNPLKSGLIGNFYGWDESDYDDYVSIPLNRVWLETRVYTTKRLLEECLNPLKSGLIGNKLGCGLTTPHIVSIPLNRVWLETKADLKEADFEVAVSIPLNRVWLETNIFKNI